METCLPDTLEPDRLANSSATWSVPDVARDRVAEEVISSFGTLPGRGKPHGCAWTVLAGIVGETTAGNDRNFRVLALATGTRCIGVSTMAVGDGKAVHDCHAEVLCRRAFHRYLFADIRDSSADGILERDGESMSWQLRPGIKLHFYVSTLPCGESTLVPITNTTEGTLLRKNHGHMLGDESVESAPCCDRNRTGAKPATGMPEDPKHEGAGFHSSDVLRYKSGRSDTRPDARTVCYSCSDKVCRWNHIGWQGSLLSRLVSQPLQMTSIVIGGPLFDELSVRRALFDRGGPAAEGIVCPQFLHTPVILPCSRDQMERALSTIPSAKVSTTGLSIVWTPLVGCPKQPGARSISRNVAGFHDILIGHTGERQGLRSERQGARHSGKDSQISVVNSWVSPLCKRLQSEDALETLAEVARSPVILQSWLGNLDSGDASHERPLKRHRNGGGADVRPCDDSAGTSELASLKSYDDAHDSGAKPRQINYEDVKSRLSSEAYRDRKKRFHESELFSLWKCKQHLTHEVFDGARVADVDRFLVSMP